MLRRVKNLDLFAAPVPSFNLAGEESRKTWAGALSSILIMTLTLLFGLVKLEHMT